MKKVIGVFILISLNYVAHPQTNPNSESQYKPIDSEIAQELEEIEIKISREAQERDSVEDAKYIHEFINSGIGYDMLNLGIELINQGKLNEALKKFKQSELYYSRTSQDLTEVYLNIAWCNFYLKNNENALEYIYKINYETVERPMALWQLSLMSLGLKDSDLFKKYINKLRSAAIHDNEAASLFKELNELLENY